MQQTSRRISIHRGELPLRTSCGEDLLRSDESIIRRVFTRGNMAYWAVIMGLFVAGYTYQWHMDSHNYPLLTYPLSPQNIDHYTTTTTATHTLLTYEDSNDPTMAPLYGPFVSSPAPVHGHEPFNMPSIVVALMLLTLCVYLST